MFATDFAAWEAAAFFSTEAWEAAALFSASEALCNLAAACALLNLRALPKHLVFLSRPVSEPPGGVLSTIDLHSEPPGEVTSTSLATPVPFNGVIKSVLAGTFGSSTSSLFARP